MPEFKKVSHTSLSVRDRHVAADWWMRVFGLEQIDESEGEGWKGILLVHKPSAAIIEFQQHDANKGETFDPTRTGFDHMGLMVESRAELDDWKAHFERLGVKHSPIVDADYGSVLTFKDPDEIQFEMFYRANHP